MLIWSLKKEKSTTENILGWLGSGGHTGSVSSLCKVGGKRSFAFLSASPSAWQGISLGKGTTSVETCSSWKLSMQTTFSDSGSWARSTIGENEHSPASLKSSPSKNSSTVTFSEEVDDSEFLCSLDESRLDRNFALVNLVVANRLDLRRLVGELFPTSLKSFLNLNDSSINSCSKQWEPKWDETKT